MNTHSVPNILYRRNRDTIAERDRELDPELVEAKRIEELEQRKKQSHDLVAETILRELAESTYWFGCYYSQEI